MASYSELFTITLVGELCDQLYETVWYRLVQQNHQDLFPKLPEHSRHRVTRNAEGVWAELALYITRQLPDSARRFIDAKPLPVAKGKPGTFSRTASWTRSQVPSSRQARK